MKIKGMKEAQFLSLLKKVLPKTTKDPHLASAIYDEVAKEVRLLKSIESFEKFCETGALPDIAPETVANFQNDLTEKFGEASVALTPDENGTGVTVEIALPDRTISTRVKVDPTVAEEEVKVPFVPFPVSLPEDPELVWLLARREDLGPDEAVPKCVTSSVQGRAGGRRPWSSDRQPGQNPRPAPRARARPHEVCSRRRPPYGRSQMPCRSR